MCPVESLKTHSKFKKTEIGEIPVDWEVVHLGEVIDQFINGGTPETKEKSYWEGNIPWITGADFENQKIKNIRRYITKNAVKNSSTNVIPQGNVLVVTRTGVGKLAIAPFDVAISQDITGVIPKGNLLNPNFLYWYLNNYSHRLTAIVQGTSINGLLREDLATFPMILPPDTEQKKIAEILSSVDAAIEKIDTVIEKTKQLKKGLMHQLLTRGIEHTKFKKSQIGPIPNEWEIRQIHEICEKPQYGFTASAKDKPVGPKLLRITDIQDGGVNWETVPYCECPNSSKSDYLLHAGDILFARTGATTGKSYLIKECPEAVFASYLIRVVTKEMIIPDYLFLVFNSTIYWKQIGQQIGGSAQGGVNASLLAELKVPVPPKAEQLKIAETFMVMEQEVEKETLRKKNLENLKNSLMNILLTGKVRLRF